MISYIAAIRLHYRVAVTQEFALTAKQTPEMCWKQQLDVQAPEQPHTFQNGLAAGKQKVNRFFRLTSKNKIRQTNMNQAIKDTWRN